MIITEEDRIPYEGKIFTVTITDGDWSDEISITQKALELSGPHGGFSYLADLLIQVYQKHESG